MGKLYRRGDGRITFKPANMPVSVSTLPLHSRQNISIPYNLKDIMTINSEKAPAAGDTAMAEERNKSSIEPGTIEDVNVLDKLGYKAELSRNRSMATLLFQSLAIAAIPYGEGSP